MNDAEQVPPLSESAPSSNWVRFWRNYGPLPTNGNLFDEYVEKAIKRAKVAPIVLSSPFLQEMIKSVTTAQLDSILIAGTAGDGKTYHCRCLWNALGGSKEEWTAPGKIKRLTIEGGRTFIFVTDLTGLNDQESDEALEGLENSVSGASDTTYVIATNHGQILERLHGLGIRRELPSPLRNPIQKVFLQGGACLPRLRVFDLSQTEEQKVLKEIIEVVTGHPEWNHCAKCMHDSAGKICPIAENRRRLIGTNDDGQFAKRLGDLIEFSRINGSHLPVRDLLALTTNMILGHKDARDGLLTCQDIPMIQEASSHDRGSIYDNVFGSNLPGMRALSGQFKAVFKALSSFGIGEETTNGMDELLVYGADDSRLSSAFTSLVGSDPIYGETHSFRAMQERYLEGEEEARLEGGASAFLDRLVYQRRRLFFTLPNERSDYPYWNLTAFRFAGDYLELLAAIQGKSAVNDRTRSKLAQGLNRVLTGLLIDNHDKLFIGSSGGFTQSKISVLCETELPSRRRSGGIGMSLRHDSLTRRPCVDVAMAPGGNASVIFGLTPVRFEFLCRVADGALPGSFSNECLEDLLAFKARLLRQAEILKIATEDEPAEEGCEEDGALVLTFIEIEQTGHAYSKPISVRAEA